MNGMGAAPPPSNGTATTNHRRHMMMHMTFFWGHNTEVLFHGWPGYDHMGNYLFALAVVFFLAFAVEWLSHCNILPENSPPPSAAASGRSAAVGVIQAILHSVRIGLAYLVMLAVMSFNGGVFLAAVGGYGVGFFFFGSRAFDKRTFVPSVKNTDLPPMNCC
ncbi:hypothetical protein ABFS82_14G169200 [Erythranthe guttata]